LQDPNATIGQRDGLSGGDIQKLERMYASSSYVTPSQFITLIIVTLLLLTNLQ